MNLQSKMDEGEGRGAGIWAFITHEENFTPSGFSSLGWIRLLQSFHPFGVGRGFKAIHDFRKRLGMRPYSWVKP